MKLSFWQTLLVAMLIVGTGQAYAKVRYLQPTAFPELPSNLAQELTRRGCRIPQVEKGKQSNVISGEFVESGRTDWAVLCSVKSATTLLVFRNGSEQEVWQIETKPNGYSSWSIAAATEDSVMRWAEVWNHDKPSPTVSHKGIHSFVEWGSGDRFGDVTEAAMLYCDQGHWTPLGTAVGN